jgi:hypothetical protein
MLELIGEENEEHHAVLTIKDARAALAKAAS